MPLLRPSKKETKKFLQALLMLIAALLIFGGPTYLLYILNKLEIPKLILLLIGLAAFAVGIILFAHLSKEEGKVKASI